MPQRSSVYLILALLLAIVLIVVGSFYYSKKKFELSPQSISNTKNSNSSISAKNTIADQYAKEREEGRQNPAPVITHVASSTLVSPGQEFILHSGEAAHLKGTDTFLYVEGFYIPPNGADDYDIGIRCHLITNKEDNGCLISNSQHFDVGVPHPYDGMLLGTDNKTYAKFVFKDLSAECLAQSETRRDGCWSDLAQKMGSSYCEEVGNQSTKDSCFEKLASRFSSFGLADSEPQELCSKVENPKDYCRIFSKSYWATFHDSKHGISLSYPTGWVTLKAREDGSIILMPKDFDPDLGYGEISVSLLPADTIFSTAESWGDQEGKMYFDYTTNQWILEGKPTCREVNNISELQIPLYYLNMIHGAETDGIILKQGILALDESIEPPMPHTELYWRILQTITFDSATTPIRAQCDKSLK